MRMAVETSLRIAIGGFVARQVPDDQGLVTAGREEHVRTNLQVSNQFHKRLVLCFAYFSREVAKAVTHPECPSRVPLSTNCSPMLGSECAMKTKKLRVSLRAQPVFDLDVGVYYEFALSLCGFFVEAKLSRLQRRI